MRTQPKRGLRRFILTMAATSSAEGPLGPGLRRCDEEAVVCHAGPASRLGRATLPNLRPVAVAYVVWALQGQESRTRILHPGRPRDLAGSMLGSPRRGQR